MLSGTCSAAALARDALLWAASCEAGEVCGSARLVRECSDSETAATGSSGFSSSESGDDEAGVGGGSCRSLTAVEAVAEADAGADAEDTAGSPNEVEGCLSLEAEIQDLLEAEGVGWIDKASASLELLTVAVDALGGQPRAEVAAFVKYAEAEAEAAGLSAAGLALELLALGPGGEAVAEEAATRAGLCGAAAAACGFTRAAAAVQLLEGAAQALPQQLTTTALLWYVEAEAESFALNMSSLATVLVLELQ